MVNKGDLLWSPSKPFQADSGMARFMTWLAGHRGLTFRTYDELWAWSVRDLEEFWQAVWDYFEVRSSTPYARVLSDRTMPGAQWFPGAHVNYAQHLLARGDDDAVAVH